MKKRHKIRITLIIVGLLIGLALIGAFVIYPAWHYFTTRDEAKDINEPELANVAENIDFNSDNGLLYINDEIIIMTYEGTTRMEVDALVEEFSAEIVSAMEDIGFWQIRFKDEMTYDDLNKTLKKLKKSEIVEDAYFNSVYEVEPDRIVVEDEKEIEPFYPNDPWDGDAKTWNMDVPRGSNWGMEAIHAPAAWGYLDQMTDINIGVIDTVVDKDHDDINLTASYITVTETFSNTYDASNYTPGDHGTHVSGIMAGGFNNGTGITGVMGDKANLYYSAAYTIKDGKTSDYYSAYDYLMALNNLIERDVKVINISQNTSRLIGFAASKGNSNAIKYLENAAKIAGNGLLRIVNKGEEFVICVAAGNSNNTAYYRDKKKTYGYKENWTWIWEIFKKDSGGSEAKYNNFLNLIDIEKVKSRIIVVGSLGIDRNKSKEDETRYHYSAFSNIGSRVDVVAPGELVYSSVVGDYAYLSGTSMATPHVAGVAGLIFACNPDLSGLDVKRILLASTNGRYYYNDGYSGLVSAELAVKNALETREHSVNRVVKATTSDGLDLCFVVDTTGSMDDDIQNAKDNMNKILDELSTKNENFRVALVDYRDFAIRAASYDYPSKLQLDFSQDKDEITNAINSLDLGNGGDENETVYSGLMEAVGLKWRPQAQKAIIVLGDAPPLDPEPFTGYTLDSVVGSLYDAEISLVTDTTVNVDIPDYEQLTQNAQDSMINVYSIGTDASDEAADAFRIISEATGGSYTGVDSASGVSDAIISTIESIEITPSKTVKASFGEEYSGETIELYRDGQFEFEINLDDNGELVLENMELDKYQWSIPRLLSSGSIKVNENNKRANISFDEAPWYSFAISLWQRQRTLVITFGIIGLISLIAVIVIIKKLVGWVNRRKGVHKNKPEDTCEPEDTQKLEDSQKPEYTQKPEHIRTSEDILTSENKFKSEIKVYKCTSCGAEYDSQIKFCGKCGKKMS